MAEKGVVGESTINQEGTRSKRFRSLSSKFSLFTGTLVAWVVGVILLYEWRDNAFHLERGIAFCVLIAFAASAIAKFTIRLIGRPLSLLRDGITSVKDGRLEPIQVSQTGDEIEQLGDAFNGMISALSESRAEVREYQEQLENKIRQRTEDLESAMHRALAASKAKSEFLANVSHELRTPMNGVIGMLDIVLDSRLTHDQRDHLEIAQRCAYSLLAIVNDLLDLSKIEAGKMALEKAPFKVRSVVEDCVKAHIPVAVNKGIAVYSSVDADVPERIVGDALRIRQILNNLLGNAVKFTESGSVSITVSAEALQDIVELNIAVKDTGTGIPAERLPHIFEKFTQADGSISRKYGGTGLGLAITRKLAEIHGGSIEVESEVGAGSLFKVRLACELPKPELGGSTSAAPNEAQEKSGSSGARILVVEDNLVNQKVVTALLRKRGYEPVLANNGVEALERLSNAPSPNYYRLVLMDIQMPMLDGLQATRIIRAESRWDRLPIVAMTAHAMQADRDECLRAGMNGYISKPVNPPTLIATVERFLLRPSVGSGEPAEITVGASTRLSTSFAGADNDLVEGMVHIFLQLAPERLQRLSMAARQKDALKLIEESQKISSAAERIAATGVKFCTRELENAANAEDFDHVHHSLARLAEEITALQQNVSV